MQFNLSVQRALPGNWDLTLGYAGSRELHRIRVADRNLAPSILVHGVKTYQPSLGRRNATFGGVTQRETDAQSLYNALQAGLSQRPSQGLRAHLSYTFS